MKPPYIGGDTLGVEMSGPLDLPDEKIFHRRGGDIKVPGGEMALHFDTSLDDIRRGKISATNLLQGNISLTDTPGDAGGTCLLRDFITSFSNRVQTSPRWIRMRTPGQTMVVKADGLGGMQTRRGRMRSMLKGCRCRYRNWIDCVRNASQLGE